MDIWAVFSFSKPSEDSKESIDLTSDDANLLPEKLIKLYKNPYRAFGLDENSADISAVRNAFRKHCLSFISSFSELGRPKLDLQQLVFAYHLIRKTVQGPAAKLRVTMASNPYLDFRPEDILPLLRPMNSTSFQCAKEYRGFRMLTVVCSNTTIQLRSDKSQLPRMVFQFDVHYCLRRHHVEKDYEDVHELHEHLSQELLTLPSFPEMSVLDIVGLSSRDYLGRQLADYMLRIHNMLANKGMFCPRLLKFLNIDFEKVQSEEEGTLAALLDTTTKPSSSAWHIISEEWLIRWRKFVMGRGARRYFPPGKITNEFLAEECKKEGRKDLKIGVHYRAVNYNVWKFYKMVHGGGPCISRQTDNIYSPYQASELQGAIMIQTRIRICLARLERERRFVKELSHCKTAKAVIYEMSMERLKKRVEEKIRSDQVSRKQEQLEQAASQTQSRWRKRKGYVPEVNLKREKLDQEVFTKSYKLIPDEEPSGQTDGQVVETVHPIIHFGNTFVYGRSISEEIGVVPFSTKRIPGTESAMIWDCQQATEYVDGSKIISINGHPCSGLTYQMIKDKLVSVPWPLVLELERPVILSQLPSLDSIVILEDPVVQYNAFKLLLKTGLKCVKLNTANSKFHCTTIKATESELMYRGKSDPRKSEDKLWKRFSLFDIKFVKTGRDSSAVQRKSRIRSLGVDPDCCFELVCEDRSVIFGFPDSDVLEALWAEDSLLYENKSREKNSAENKYETEQKLEGLKALATARNVREKFIAKLRILEAEALRQATLKKATSKNSATTAGKGVFSWGYGSIETVGNADEARGEDLQELAAYVDPNESDEELEFVNAASYSAQLHKLGLLSTELGTVPVEEYYVKLRAATVCRMFQSLVEEVRKMQIHIDDSGLTVRRTRVKTSLKKVES